MPPDIWSRRGGYYWIGHQNDIILADGKITIVTIPTFFGKRPGYVHNTHIAFLDSMADAVERGKDPAPYLLGEFPELDDAQAEAIIRWWRGSMFGKNGNGNK